MAGDESVAPNGLIRKKKLGRGIVLFT